jgi:hypothetical protein
MCFRKPYARSIVIGEYEGTGAGPTPNTFSLI